MLMGFGNEMKCHLFCMQAKSRVNERIRWSMHEGRALVLINNLKIPRQERIKAACTKQLFEALKKKKKSSSKKKPQKTNQQQQKNPSKKLLKRLVCSDLLVALELKVADNVTETYACIGIHSYFYSNCLKLCPYHGSIRENKTLSSPGHLKEWLCLTEIITIQMLFLNVC